MGAPLQSPTVLTSHVEGQRGPCQGPPVKQPQGQQGRKAGSERLTSPQACGQHQGGHKHNSAAKPGGGGGHTGMPVRTAQGFRWTLRGSRGGAAPHQSQPMPRMIQPSNQPRRWLICSSGTFQPFSHTRFHCRGHVSLSASQDAPPCGSPQNIRLEEGFRHPAPTLPF